MDYDVPYAVTVVSDSEMILILVETHLCRLTSVVEKTSGHIPRAATRNGF